MSKPSSLAPVCVLASLAASILLLADVAPAVGARVTAAKNAATTNAPQGPRTPALARRCDPPPCPASMRRTTAASGL